MAAGTEVKENNHSSLRLFHHGMDDVSHNCNLDNCAENMGSLQHITNFEGKSQGVEEWLRCH